MKRITDETRCEKCAVILITHYRESSAPELGAGGTVIVRLGPRQQRIISEAIDFLRQQGAAIGPKGMASYAGFLQVTVEGTNPADIFAGARALAPSPAGGQFGVFTPAIFAGQEAFPEAFLFGLRSDENHRTNVSVLNAGLAGNGSVTLEVQFFDADRRSSVAGAPASVTLAPGEWTQLLNPLADRSVRSGMGHNCAESRVRSLGCLRRNQRWRRTWPAHG